MPPTQPCGIPCFAVVFARLMSLDTFLGVRQFVVQLSDGTSMMPGITSRSVSVVESRQYVNVKFLTIRITELYLLGEARPMFRTV